MDTKSVMAFIGGALLGAATTLLLAPDSGENTRNKIAKRAKEGYNNLKDRVDQCKTHCNTTPGEGE